MDHSGPHTFPPLPEAAVHGADEASDSIELVTSWTELLTRLDSLRAQEARVFRGEPQVFPSCLSLLARKSPADASPAEAQYWLEAQLHRRFIQDAFVHLDDVSRTFLGDPIRQLILMRHYGAPTRLLDWTASPWVAAYFAAAADQGQSGRVLWFNNYILEQVVHERYSTQTGDLASVLRPDSQAKTDEWVVCLYDMGPRFPRLAVQKGLHTFSSRPSLDHWATIRRLLDQSGETATYGALELSADCKAEVLSGLAAMGLTATALFPGLEGVCQQLCHEARDIDYSRELERITGALPYPGYSTAGQRGASMGPGA